MSLPDAAESGSLWAMLPSPLPEEPPIDPSLVTPGLLGMGAFLFLVIAVALLYRSLRHQLKKVNPDLPEEPPREPEIPIIDTPRVSPTESQSTDTSAGGDPPARA